jgi:hypothetical protein
MIDERQSLDPAGTPDGDQASRWPESLLNHPLHPNLDAALTHFEFGDYRSTRRSLAPILQSSDAPGEFRVIAEKLTRAMDMEPGAIAVAVACSALFLFILWLVY